MEAILCTLCSFVGYFGLFMDNIFNYETSL